MGSLGRIWEGIASVLLPAHCVGCGREGTYLCSGCLAGAPRPGSFNFPRGTFAFDTATAPFAHDGVPRTAVHRLKYSGLRALAPAMAAPMAEAFALRRVQAGVLVPIPLHPRRLRERGYNQAALLAKGVARLLDLPIEEHALVRTIYEQPQVWAGAWEARMANVEGAFAPAPGTQVAGQEVALVDDVMTTGSTLDSAARTLKDAGARRVHAIIFTREG